MKVLQVINSLATGGAEKLLLDLCPRMRRRGVDCKVAMLTDRGNRFGPDLASLGVPVLVVSPDSSPYDPRHAARLRSLLRRESPDVAHVHLFPSQYWCATAGKSGAVLVTTEHNLRNRRMDNPVFAPIERIVYRRYSRIVAISAGVEAALLRHLGPAAPVVLIPNGIDAERFRGWGGKDRKPDGCVHIGMAARFTAQKDQATILKALAVLPRSFRADFAGTGETRPSIESLARNLGLLERVTFWGDVPDVRTFYAGLDIYVQSSHWEGFGIAALEAMASGLPVVASELPGLKDVVSDAGSLFPAGDTEVLASALLALSTPEARGKSSSACRRRAKMFDVEIMTDALIRLYEEVANTRDNP